jgi:hypothetical protein
LILALVQGIDNDDDWLMAQMDDVPQWFQYKRFQLFAWVLRSRGYSLFGL